ncbi:MAG: acetylxylan esterase [Gemmatimonadaceae bacterium]|nr:acetylxylan esterase [Gemmatimonadaceae bacterium]
MRAFRQLAVLAVLAVLVIAAEVLPAQQSDTTTRLLVTLDHPDWLYRVGDTARFSVSLVRGGRTVSGARVRLDVARERSRPTRRDTIMTGAAPYIVATSERIPGFIRLTATSNYQGATYTEVATAGFDPTRIEPSIAMPADFEQFWRAAIADARRVPLQPVMTRMPERSTPEVDVYHVRFDNQAPGSHLYGILSMPTSPGTHPAVLSVPGAGVRPYFPNIAMAKRGVIYLAIGIHGIPVDRDSLLYNELRATALARYYTYGLEDRDLYYYKRVFVGVVRAGDFIFGLPQFDGTNYVVQGGSQGGGLSLVAAAIDPRVKAIAVTHPAMADQLGYLKGYAGGWPHLFSDTTPVRAKKEKLETIAYYDAINFARLVRVPGFYTFGFNDPVVPPSASYATYNTVTAPKELFIAKETAHNTVKAQTERTTAWVLAHLGMSP